MNFKVGDTVKTHDGREVEILKTNAPGDKPIIVMFFEDGCTVHLHSDGRYYQDGTKSGYDLIPPKRTREVTVLVDVYIDRVHVYSPEPQSEWQTADCPLAVAVQRTFTVEW